MTPHTDRSKCPLTLAQEIAEFQQNHTRLSGRLKFYDYDQAARIITALEAKLNLARDGLKDIELHSHEVETIGAALSAWNASSLDEPLP